MSIAFAQISSKINFTGFDITMMNNTTMTNFCNVYVYHENELVDQHNISYFFDGGYPEVAKCWNSEEHDWHVDAIGNITANVIGI